MFDVNETLYTLNKTYYYYYYYYYYKTFLINFYSIINLSLQWYHCLFYHFDLPPYPNYVLKLLPKLEFNVQDWDFSLASLLKHCLHFNFIIWTNLAIGKSKTFKFSFKRWQNGVFTNSIAQQWNDWHFYKWHEEPFLFFFHSNVKENWRSCCHWRRTYGCRHCSSKKWHAKFRLNSALTWLFLCSVY